MLKDALTAVETGMSLKKAAKDFSILRTTLRNHLKLKRKGDNFSMHVARTDNYLRLQWELIVKTYRLMIPCFKDHHSQPCD